MPQCRTEWFLSFAANSQLKPPTISIRHNRKKYPHYLASTQFHKCIFSLSFQNVPVLSFIPPSVDVVSFAGPVTEVRGEFYMLRNVFSRYSSQLWKLALYQNRVHQLALSFTFSSQIVFLERRRKLHLTTVLNVD